MSVTEVLRGLGSWNLQLSDKTPREVLDALKYYGHIAIHTGRVDYRVMGDAALTSSRYTGVLRSKVVGDVTTIGGPGMAMWLGDEDYKGDVYETAKTFTNTPFQETIRQLLPASGSVTEGTIFNLDKDYTGSFKFVTPREAIDYVCETLGADWIVRGDATLDAGLEGDLFRVEPQAMLIRRQGGVDMRMKALRGFMETEQDVEDFTTRVLLLAEGEGESTATATADIDPGKNPYRDINGNPVKFTRIVSETATESTNAEARAQLQLNRFSGTRDAISLSTAEYDLKGDVAVGDYIWVYDPDLGLIDETNEVIFRGKRYNPVKLRLTEITWPIGKNMSVGFRDWDGVWYNLTDYLIPESGESNLVVGGYNRSLTSGDRGAGGGTGGGTPQPNTTIPGKPTWVEPFRMAVYQSPVTGESKAQVELEWTRPENTDGSTILDGDHYEIRWRNASTPIYPVTWAQLEQFTWAQLEDSGATWEEPIKYQVGEWQYQYVPWSELRFFLQELSPNMPYEAQIRAVDGAVPANVGEWSDVVVFQTTSDTIPPATPDAPKIAASRIAVQMTHHLGRADGGTFNLDPDLHHLELHGQYEPNFQPTETTLIGKAMANHSMMQAQVPVVATFQIESVNPMYYKVVAVDNDGNKSGPSVAVEQTVELIDDAHISDLTVSKVTAGTISADWLVGATIATARTGSRVEMNPDGLKMYDDNNQLTMDANANDGSFWAIGELASGTGGRYLVVNPTNSGVHIPEVRFYPRGAGSNYSYLNAPATGDAAIAGIGLNSGNRADNRQYTVWVADNFAKMARTITGAGITSGSYFQARDGSATMGWQDSALDWYFGIYRESHFILKGTVPTGNGIGPTNGMFFFLNDWDGGAFTFNFGATMSGWMGVVANFCAFGGYNTSVNTEVYNLNASGCQVGTGVAGVNGRYSVMAFRSDNQP